LFCNILEIFSLIGLVLRTELIFENEKDSKKNCFQMLILYVILTRLDSKFQINYKTIQIIRYFLNCPNRLALDVTRLSRANVDLVKSLCHRNRFPELPIILLNSIFFYFLLLNIAIIFSRSKFFFYLLLQSFTSFVQKYLSFTNLYIVNIS